MGKLRMQEYRCDECGWQLEQLIELPDGAPNSMDSCPQIVECTNCAGDARPIISAPRIMNVALPEGTDRGDTWKRAKEAAKLRQMRKGLRPEKRAEVDKEIAKLNRENNIKGRQDRFRT